MLSLNEFCFPVKAESGDSQPSGGAGNLLEGRPYKSGILVPDHDITSEYTLIKASDAPWVPFGDSKAYYFDRFNVSGFICLLDNPENITSKKVATLLHASYLSYKRTYNEGGLSTSNASYTTSTGSNFTTSGEFIYVDGMNGAVTLKANSYILLKAGYKYFWVFVQNQMRV